MKFVGEDRQHAIDDLLVRFDETRDSRVPMVFCILGEPGVGKTRLVQEFYERLAGERQSEPRYWPSTLLDDPAADVLSRRKLIAPGAFIIPAGAVPSWIWWGISCQRDLSGKPMRSIRQAIGQFDAHVSYLAERASDKDEQLQRWSANLKTCIDLVGLANPLGAIPSTVSFVGKALEKFSKTRRHQAELERDRTVDAAALNVEENDVQAAAIARVAADGLPMVIAVDDAHWADPTMVRFLNDLAQRSDASVMIVVTAYDHEIRRQQAEQRPGSFGAWLASAETQGRAEVLRMGRLAVSDLAEAVMDVARRTSQEKAIALARRADGIPLVLALLLELDVVRRDIAPDGKIDLDPRELEVPAGIEGVYQELWRDLPDSVRTALVLAALQGPQFLPDSIAEVSAELGVFEAVDALGQAESTYRWITTTSGLGFFVEPRRFDTAANRQADLFTDDDIDKAARALCSFLTRARCEASWTERPATARTLALRLLIRLNRDGVDLPADQIRAAAQELLALLPEDESAERVRLRRLLVDLRQDEPAVSSDAGDSRHDEARVELLAELVSAGDGQLIQQHRDVLNDLEANSAQDLELLAAAEELTEPQPDADAQVPGTDGPLPYRAWVVEAVGELTELQPSEIGDLIADVVNAESPVTVGRVYRLLVDASPASRLGRNIRGALDRGVNSALRRELIDRPANDKRSDGDRRVLTVPNPPPASVREPGPRTLEEMPAIELATLAWKLLADLHDLDAVKAEIASRFGYTRRSDRIDEILDDAMRYLEPPALAGPSADERDPVDAVLELAERRGSYDAINDYLYVAAMLGLEPRAHKTSISLTAPQDRRRTLVRIAPLSGGRVAVGYNLENWSKIYDLDRDFVAEKLRTNWAELEGDAMWEAVADLAEMTLMTWTALAEDNHHLIVVTDLRDSEPCGNSLYWLLPDEDPTGTFDGAVQDVSPDLAAGETILLQLFDVTDGLSEPHLMAMQLLGGTEAEAARWQSRLTEDPLSALCALVDKFRDEAGSQDPSPTAM